MQTQMDSVDDINFSYASNTRRKWKVHSLIYDKFNNKESIYILKVS
jgi:hypothetical protein